MNTLIKNNKKAKAIFIGLCLIVLAAIHAAGVFFPSESGMAVYAAGSDRSAMVATTSYNLVDNTGYKPPANPNTSNPLGNNYAMISIDALTETGVVESAGNSNYYVANNINAASDEHVLVHNAACARKILVKETGIDMKGFDAHHQIPQKFRSDFGKLGINVDDPKYLQWMEHRVHNAGSYAYNQKWETALKEAGKSGSITGDVVENIWDALKNAFGK